MQGYIDQVIHQQQTLVVRYSVQLQDHLLLSINDIQNFELPEESWFEAIINYVQPSARNHTAQVMWSVRNITKATQPPRIHARARARLPAAKRRQCSSNLSDGRH